MIETTHNRSEEEIAEARYAALAKADDPKIYRELAQLTIYFLKLVYQQTKAGNQLTPARLAPFVTKVDEVLNR